MRADVHPGHETVVRVGSSCVRGLGWREWVAVSDKVPLALDRTGRPRSSRCGPRPPADATNWQVPLSALPAAVPTDCRRGPLPSTAAPL